MGAPGPDAAVVAEVKRSRVSLDELEPLRERVHGEDRDLIVVLTDGER